MAWLFRSGIGKYYRCLPYNFLWNSESTGQGVRCQIATSSNNEKSCNSESGELERIITSNLKSGKISAVFQLLNTADDDALKKLKKRTWGSVFYTLNEYAEYWKLDNIRRRTKDLKVKCGEGAYTTLIRSYITRREVTEAIGILNDMKTEGLLRHSRTYFPIIESLAKKGSQKKAFELFDEMQQHIFKSHKSISLVTPSNMSVALIKSCIQDKKKEAAQTKENFDRTDYEKAKDVFKLYNQSGWPLTLDILEATKDWLRNDPVNEWVVRECLISEKGLCSSCLQFLNSGQLSTIDRFALQSNILNTVQSIFKEKEMSKRLHFQRYEDFLETFGPFDIIIDGMNIGLSSRTRKQMKRFNFEILTKVTNHFVEQDKKVLVLVNSSMQLSTLGKGVHFFVAHVGCDDMFIIYASATCSLKPYIVTRDKFREHRFFLDLSNHSLYLRWIRIHTVRVGVQNDKLRFNRHCYDPVVQGGEASWHFPVVGGRWFCAQQIK